MSKQIDPNTIVLDNAATIVTINANPHKAGARSHAFFDRYAVGTTVGAVIAAAKADKIPGSHAEWYLRCDIARAAVVTDAGVNATRVRPRAGAAKPTRTTAVVAPTAEIVDLMAAITGGTSVNRGKPAEVVAAEAAAAEADALSAAITGGTSVNRVELPPNVVVIPPAEVVARLSKRERRQLAAG